MLPSPCFLCFNQGQLSWSDIKYSAKHNNYSSKLDFFQLPILKQSYEWVLLRYCFCIIYEYTCKKTGFLIVSLLTLYCAVLLISMVYAIKRSWLQAYQANQESAQAIFVAL